MIAVAQRTDTDLPSTLPLAVQLVHTHSFTKSYKLVATERLGHAVGNHLVGGDIDRFDFTSLNRSADKMETDIDMLCTHMEGSVGRESESALIVAVESGWTLNEYRTEFLDKLAAPD